MLKKKKRKMRARVQSGDWYENPCSSVCIKVTLSPEGKLLAKKSLMQGEQQPDLYCRKLPTAAEWARASQATNSF